MEKDTLYERGKIKITYLHSPEPGREKEVISGEDHELWIRKGENEWRRYILQREILRELADAAKRSSSDLVDKLMTVNLVMLHRLRSQEITLDEIGNVFIEAYRKEEEEFERVVLGNRTD